MRFDPSPDTLVCLSVCVVSRARPALRAWSGGIYLSIYVTDSDTQSYTHTCSHPSGGSWQSIGLPAESGPETRRAPAAQAKKILRIFGGFIPFLNGFITKQYCPQNQYRDDSRHRLGDPAPSRRPREWDYPVRRKPTCAIDPLHPRPSALHHTVRRSCSPPCSTSHRPEPRIGCERRGGAGLAPASRPAGSTSCDAVHVGVSGAKDSEPARGDLLPRLGAQRLRLAREPRPTPRAPAAAGWRRLVRIAVPALPQPTRMQRRLRGA